MLHLVIKCQELFYSLHASAAKNQGLTTCYSVRIYAFHKLWYKHTTKMTEIHCQHKIISESGIKWQFVLYNFYHNYNDLCVLKEY